ncbi:hypothetical protein D0809_20985 [Flavobacterium circumlabens]|uniref:Uncharacterized protein n=1 Tax=Flavobacterium circumlabens TaxID=2133765 RepID=A0A4Y7U9D5_9FLAO|nr:hypothetical protein [Flavobacterium circumlabens]TCN53074.1 hypothetical protein EV142_10957 [Flavobacterium circumlabens]TEB42372.1 hypothetical protein D0809_20985 [Flavobacterium circumlabens]
MMKKGNTIGDLLGIQQEEMAMLLVITASQWSMYASGKRNLPEAAQLKLAKMLAFVDKLDKEELFRMPPVRQTESEINNFWEERSITNQRKLKLAIARLETCRAKYKKGFIAWHLIDFLETQEEEERPKWQEKHLQNIRDRAEAAMQKNNPELQEQYEFKIRLLQYEEQLLKDKISTN